jgi:hypothetical protein
MLIYDQFGTIQNLQMSPIPQTSNGHELFFAGSYSKLEIVIANRHLSNITQKNSTLCLG